MSEMARLLFSFLNDITPKIDEGGMGFSLRSRDYKDPPCVVLENHPADSRVTICKDNIVQTLNSRMGTGGGNVPMVMESKEPILLESNQNHATIQTDGISTALPASAGMGGGYVPMVTDKEKKEMNMVVRRLTPLECERLQGFPDGWTDIGEWTDSKGKKHKDADSPR